MQSIEHKKNMTNRVHVAVGIIYNESKDKVLISKRSSKQHLAGYWEFPGGKIEPNEKIEAAHERIHLLEEKIRLLDHMENEN